MCTYLYYEKIEISTKKSSNNACAMCCVSSDFPYKSICCGYSFDCIDKLMQFKWVPATCLYKKVDISALAICNLKTTVLLDCLLIGGRIRYYKTKY